MGQRKLLATVLVVIAVVLAGCAGAGSDGGDGAPEQLEGGGDGGGSLGGDADAASGAPDSGTEASGSSEAGSGQAGGDGARNQVGGNSVRQLATDRAIIRTGSVTVRVGDFETQRGLLASEVERLGGYVGGSQVERHSEDNETWRTGTVTLRVPSESFSRMLSYAKDRGEVLAEETSTTDVTDQLVELDARLRNLERKRDRIREFYENAESTDALLRIEDRLSEVQGQIERLEAEKRSLDDRVNFATLTVTLQEPDPDEGSGPDPSRAGLVGTLQESLDSLLGAGYGALLLVVAALPWLVAALLGLGVLVGLGRLVGPLGIQSRLGRPSSTAQPTAGQRTTSRGRSGSRPAPESGGGGHPESRLDATDDAARSDEVGEGAAAAQPDDSREEHDGGAVDG